MDLDRAAAILDAHGIPYRQSEEAAKVKPTLKDCPNCKSGPHRRRRSGGFGQNFDLCGECGFQFAELTVEGVK